MKDYTKQLRKVIKDSEDYPEFIREAEVNLYFLENILTFGWSRTDLIQIINELQLKLDKTKK